jgi:hypothetical protein
MVNTFRDLIDKMGGPAAFGRAVGMEPNSAKQARRRNSLSPQWFAPAVEAAQEKGLDDVTVERLVEWAAERRREARAA